MEFLDFATIKVYLFIYLFISVQLLCNVVLVFTV